MALPQPAGRVGDLGQLPLLRRSPRLEKPDRANHGHAAVLFMPWTKKPSGRRRCARLLDRCEALEVRVPLVQLCAFAGPRWHAPRGNCSDVSMRGRRPRPATRCARVKILPSSRSGPFSHVELDRKPSISFSGGCRGSAKRFEGISMLGAHAETRAGPRVQQGAPGGRQRQPARRGQGVKQIGAGAQARGGTRKAHHRQGAKRHRAERPQGGPAARHASRR